MQYIGYGAKIYDTLNSAATLAGYSVEKLPYGNYASTLRNPIISCAQAALGITHAFKIPGKEARDSTNPKTPYDIQRVIIIGWATFNFIWAGSTYFEPLKKASDYLEHLGATLFGVNLIFAEKTKYNVAKGAVDVTKMLALANLLPKLPGEKTFHALSLVSTGMGLYKNWPEEN